MARNFYSFEEINRVGDCNRVMTELLGMKPIGREKEWTRYNCPWRAGSDSEAFAVHKDGWCDHADGQRKGKILALYALAKLGGDSLPQLMEASEVLGEWLHLKSKEKVHAHREEVSVHVYTDEFGGNLFEAVRYKMGDGGKDIRYRVTHPGEAPTWSLTGVRLVPYNLHEVVDAEEVLIVEGEKCADAASKLGFFCSTNPMGAGSWSYDYNVHFAGKRVVLFPDNDVPGREHMRHVAVSLEGIASEIRFIELPGLKTGEDIADWIENGGTREELAFLIQQAEVLKPGTINVAERTEQEAVAKAAEANKVCFSNYTVLSIPQADGSGRKRVEVPIHITDLFMEMKTRFFGFPRRLGGVLFDRDSETAKIRIISDQNDLFAWIQEKSGMPVKWSKAVGMTSRAEFFSMLRARVPAYNMISPVPTWPPRNDVYCSISKLPAPTGSNEYLEELCDMLCFETDSDRMLFKVLVASSLYYRPSVSRPVWVIDSEHGQGVGKTKLAEICASICGGTDIESKSPLWVDCSELSSQGVDRVNKRILSPDGRTKKILLLDNVEGYFKSSTLSRLATQSTISGMAPYGHGEETRPNDLTYIITANSATLSRDLISRSFFIRLARPKTDLKNWERRVNEFIGEHKLQIVSDIIQTLDRGIRWDFSPATRFATWEQEVLAPMVGNLEDLSALYKSNEQQKAKSDGEAEEAAEIGHKIASEIKEICVAPRFAVNSKVWISSALLNKWTGECIPGFGGISGRNATQKLRNMIKGGMLPDLRDTEHRYKNCRGLSFEPPESADGPLIYVYSDKNGKMLVDSKHESFL